MSSIDSIVIDIFYHKFEKAKEKKTLYFDFLFELIKNTINNMIGRLFLNIKEVSCKGIKISILI